MRIQPRRLGFNGHVESVGLVIARADLPEPRCRARVLELWQAGSRLYAHGPWWLLLFGSPRWLDSRRSPGAPLIDHGGLLVSCPLSSSERAALPDRGVAVVAGALLTLLDLAGADPIDPADWIDVTAFCWLPVEPLPSPPVRPAEIYAVPEPDVSENLIGGLGAAPAARDELRQALARLRETQPGGDISLVDVATPRRPGWFSRLLRRSPWSKLIGRQHARYLRSMAKMFERGDYDKALLHAIPAGDVGNAVEAAPLSRLGPRSALSINPTRAAVSGSVSLDDDSFAYINQLYRKAYEQLCREGRIDEAAYVLLELLGETEEGVLFLDEHGRSKLAAEIAEARGLAPGLVVRLWFRAKQPARAVRFARRTGAFADAVVRLERIDPESAAKLRLVWADHAAATGDYANAVEAACPVAEARQLVLEWLERAIQEGGPLGARMLVRKLEVAPDTAGVVMQRASEVLRGGDLHTRLALAAAVADGPSSDAHVALGSLVTRHILPDAARSRELRELIARLKAHHVEGVLRVDVPAVTKAPQVELDSRRDVQLLRFETADVGAARIFDAAYLPNGRLLVALGELGLQLRSRRGRVLTHFDCPAHALVVGTSGLRAIATAPRARSTLLTKIDVERRRAEPWTELELTTWSQTIDDARWFVAHDNEVLAVDVTTSSPEILWRVAQPDWPVRQLASDDKTLAIWWRRADGQSELWTYALSGLRLLHRGELAHRPGGAPFTSLAPNGDACATLIVEQDADRVATRLFEAGPRQMNMIADLGSGCPPITMSNKWLVTTSEVDDRRMLQLSDVAAGRVRACIALGGAAQVGARLANRALTAFDDRGRLVVLSTITGERLRDLRISF